MAIVLDTYALDPARTAVSETLEESGGRDARIISLAGVLDGFDTVAAAEAETDTLLAAASATDPVPLALRPGRSLSVTRLKFEREIQRAERVASFVLTLEARDPFEYATTETVVAWPITASGNTAAPTTSGSVAALPTITLTADGTLVNPSVGDGTRVITYTGTVTTDQILVFDVMAERTMLDGEDVSPYTLGAYPRIDPTGTTLTYTDDAASSHLATGEIRYRDRWN